MGKRLLRAVTAIIVALAFASLFFYPGSGRMAVARKDLLVYANEKLGSYATDYSSSSLSRKHNVELAVKSIDGFVLDVGEEFSFNAVVGTRSEDRGYRKAKIIVKGRFTDGVGGGVCQVSTTLYNAVLRSGLRVAEAHPHSLPVSYVKPSFDAMVSGGADFRFVNDTPYPVRIAGCADGARVRFTLYGFPMIGDGEKREYRSVKVKDVVTAEYEEVVDVEGVLSPSEERRVIKEPREGLVSESYVDIYYKGELLSSERIRRDYYSPQKGVCLVRYDKE